LEILSEIERVRVTTSKKDPEIRRGELQKALSPYLLKAIASVASDLVSTSFGCQFITEVLFGAEGDKSEALSAIAETAGGDPSYVAPPIVPEETTATDISLPRSHIASTPFGGRMLKSLIAGGHYNMKTKSLILVSPPLNFADVLYPHVKDYIMEWATGSSSFVILALLEANFDGKDEILDILKKNKKLLKKAATEETAEQKTKREEAEAGGDVKSTKKGKKSKIVKDREVGNKGSALLLQKL